MKFKGIPIFRILDFEKAKEFYIEFLGFQIDWEHRFGQDEPVYMQVSKNDLILHLSENKRFQTGVVFVEAKGIEEFHAELLNKKSNYPVPGISRTNWNTKQMELEDPFGNLLRFNENL
jgi:catechol 2,3-dioxygenase-like lactoylglutathione lyase family enzyme